MTFKTFLAALAATCTSLHAADPAATNAPANTNAFILAMIPDAAHAPVRITNAVTIAGERVTYIAETGMLPVLKADGTSRASIFMWPTPAGRASPAARPVTFCFNGGPGSASVWLHLGALGPRRAKMNEDGSQPAPPFSLVDNEYSILERQRPGLHRPGGHGFQPRDEG
jgi:carboxypeptidase C (cathepsin A)